MADSQISLRQDKCFVSGALTFLTVKDLWLSAQKLLAAQSSWSFDFSGVSSTDSAGLALLIEWIKEAKRQSKTLRYCHVPAQLNRLASAAGVQELLASVEA